MVVEGHAASWSRDEVTNNVLTSFIFELILSYVTYDLHQHDECNRHTCTIQARDTNGQWRFKVHGRPGQFDAFGTRHKRRNVDLS